MEPHMAADDTNGDFREHRRYNSIPGLAGPTRVTYRDHLATSACGSWADAANTTLRHELRMPLRWHPPLDSRWPAG